MKKKGNEIEIFLYRLARHLDLRQRKIHLSVKYYAPQNVWIREYKHILSGLFLLLHLTKQKCVYYLSKVRQSLRLSIPVESIKCKVWSLALLHCRGYIVPFFEKAYLLTVFHFVLASSYTLFVSPLTPHRSQKCEGEITPHTKFLSPPSCPLLPKRQSPMVS